MKNFLNRFKYIIIGWTLGIAGIVGAINISVPQAPGEGYMLQGLSTGQWVASSTQTAYWGNYIATSTRTSIFPYASSTVYSSFVTSSTTDAYFGTGQGFAYIGSAGRLRTIASSTASLSWFTNDLANLTAGDTSLTFSGSYNGATARTVLLNVGRTNTWTVLQNFNYSSTTGQATFANASSTQWVGGGLQSCNATTGKLNWDSATLQFKCDTDQNTGGGGDPFTHPWLGFSATTSSMVIGTSTAANNMATLTVGSSTASQLGLFGGTGISGWNFRNAGGNLYFSTTTTAGTATTSTSALTLFGTGVPSMTIGTSTCMATAKNGSICLGGGGDAQGNTGSTTISAAKLQFDLMSNTGVRSCAFVVGTTMTVVAGACTP